MLKLYRFIIKTISFYNLKIVNRESLIFFNGIRNIYLKYLLSFLDNTLISLGEDAVLNRSEDSIESFTQFSIPNEVRRNYQLWIRMLLNQNPTILDGPQREPLWRCRSRTRCSAGPQLGFRRVHPEATFRGTEKRGRWRPLGGHAEPVCRDDHLGVCHRRALYAAVFHQVPHRNAPEEPTKVQSLRANTIRKKVRLFLFLLCKT